jgi:hypothetical protein
VFVQRSAERCGNVLRIRGYRRHGPILDVLDGVMVMRSLALRSLIASEANWLSRFT